ncbi:sperm-associated antigen 4 protein isoform X5 [Canis lupus familiaris]|uniref:sperm-associated antigen 4 protein isoform X5 n=1 Tax=Canis lupus familiaris TaxID=9615 RepID=UPI000BA9FCE9|nr:sperm-associated antigen 4 protein isoform X5 [Canis lupus familiaris]XP_038289580.1 sperm-associated antigen 4 protein isoform X5 [Canis lupus familiaris]|eukprot:XP_022264818.1 sperm-associated antigen 4 protein isoform X5 [Canis lupus familiaris]
MRRSPRPGSATSPHKHTPNFYSDNSNSSVSVTSGDSSGPRSAGPGPGEPEGRRARGSSCEPAGPPVVSEEQLDLLSTLDLRQEMPPPRVSKSFLSMGQASRNPSDPLAPLSEFQFSFLRARFRSEPGPCLLLQVLSVLLSLVGDVLIVVYREVCSIRFLLTAVSLLSLFLAALWWGLLYLIPPLENEPKEMLTLSEYHERVRSQGQQLQQLQAELDKLHKEVSSVRAANSERVAKLVFQRLNEDFVRKPDYALSSVGASIDLEKTSHDYEDANTAYFWNRFSFWNYARPPTVILEPDVFPGNCWAFEGDQGQVVIRLPGRVQLSDITLQHPPPSVAHTGGAKSAPRDFAVYGLQVDDETEVFLGKFTFNVEKSEIQTFHLQNDPPAAFPKVKIQILSNWGHPRFTCLYRVRAHGMRTSEGAGDNATGEPH